MSSELFMFLLGVFITVFVGGLTGLGFRKWYRSPLNHGIEVNWQRLNGHSKAIADLQKLARNTDSGLQTLYEIVRAIDKDVKRLKKKAKAVTLDNWPFDDGKIRQSQEETIGGVSVMNCNAPKNDTLVKVKPKHLRMDSAKNEGIEGAELDLKEGYFFIKYKGGGSIGTRLAWVIKLIEDYTNSPIEKPND